MNTELITKTEAFLKQKFDDSNYFAEHKDEKAYRLQHSYRVANIGRMIAGKEGFDETEMVIACLLHDVSYCEDFDDDGWKDHGRNAAKIARPFLTELGFTEDRINDMCYGIAIHVDDEADFEGERTPFALTVGDADNIDRFDAYRIHEGLCYEDFLKKSYEEKKELVETRLPKLKNALNMELGTKTAEELWKQRLGFYIEFYEKLLSQLNSSIEILD